MRNTSELALRELQDRRDYWYNAYSRSEHERDSFTFYSFYHLMDAYIWVLLGMDYSEPLNDALYYHDMSLNLDDDQERSLSCD